MKKFFVGILTLTLLAIFFLNFSSVSALGNVNDFTITDFQVDYYLTKDQSGRSQLRTVENITAQFPDIDQNHGIERALPLFYKKHSVDLKLQSVVDDEGNDLSYSTRRDENDNFVIRIGDVDTYVHGYHTYVITYNQSDVTAFFSDTEADEFYWDVNGLGWSQPFTKVTARLHLGDDLIDSLSGNMSCYYGPNGSTSGCEINQSDDGLIVANTSYLNANEGMTIAVGFNANTFTPYSMSFLEWVEAHIVTIVMILNAIGLVIVLFYKLTKGKDHPGRGSIAPQYLPPKGVNILTSSIIDKSSVKWAAATYIDFAVRHNVRILQQTKKVWKFDVKSYEIEFITDNGLDETEKEIITGLFGTNPEAGAKYPIDKMNRDYNLSRKMTNLVRDTRKSTIQNGYYTVDKKLKRKLFIISSIGPALGLFAWVLFNNSVLITDPQVLLPIAIFSASIGYFMVATIIPLSEKGRELADYLKGLKMYIKLAEKDRIKFLQSPEGAQKTKIIDDSNMELVHLYERVLPYAIMFGLEKEWNKLLGKFYEKNNTQPDWYVGAGAFSAASFNSALSSFTSYTSSSSSSSGGSSGGGSSGGGGGGGGGGGW